MHSFDGPTLEIDLARLKANYALLRERFTGAECAAVVKANAYGLGAAEIAPALADAGCQTFFVATLEEGIALRGWLPDRKIAIFHGVGAGEELAFINHRLHPVLSTVEQVARWAAMASESEDRPAILHVDTGMARLGLTAAEFTALPEDTAQRCQLSLLMSHLACSSDPDHSQNEAQLDAFIRAAERFPELPTSLCNSGGIFLSEAFHDDLARPGCALYGIHPGDSGASPMQPVVRLSAPVIQLRTLDEAQAAGYGATQTLPGGAKLATVALGYADGVHRCLSHKLHGYYQGQKVPLVGRVTMDLLTFDVSSVTDESMGEGARIELMNDEQTVNDIAASAGTIGYEVLTSLGMRVKRIYNEWAS